MFNAEIAKITERKYPIGGIYFAFASDDDLRFIGAMPPLFTLSDTARKGGAARRSGFSRSGFTLLESVAVIAIVGLLAGIVIGGGRRAVDAGRVARARAELAALGASLEAYRRHYGDYPRIAFDAVPESTVSGRRLYAALNGQRGPALAATEFVSRQRAVAAPALTRADPAADPWAENHFVDPWGEPYRYGYTPGATWGNAAYVLFSTGPDREATFPFSSDGLRPADYDRVLKNGRPVNADNLWANE